MCYNIIIYVCRHVYRDLYYVLTETAKKRLNTGLCKSHGFSEDAEEPILGAIP